MTRALRRMPAAAAAATLALALAISAPLSVQAASTPAPTPSEPPKASTACPDFEFIGARGSGEDNSVPASRRYTAANPTFGMGGELADLYRRITTTAAPNEVTITPYGVPYPAIGIDVVGSDALISGDLSAYSKSVELGAHAAAAELDRVSRACPDTGVVMAGYSQGAQVIVDAVLSATPSARKSLVAAVFFGNTYFDSADSGDDYGSYDPDLDGYVLHSGTGELGGATGSSDWAARFGDAAIFDYCHDGDPICGLVDERRIDGVTYPVRDFAHIVAVSANDDGQPNILAQHGTYQGGDTANAAQQLRFVLGLPLEPAGPPAATITSPQSVELGRQASFNAGGSLSDPADPIVSYRWSIDAGTAAARTITTIRPLMSTAFFTTGAHTISLRVTTLSGASAQASARITAAARPTAAPGTPAKVTAAAGDSAATLSWPATAGAQFYAVTDASGRLLTAFTPLVSGQQTVSWTDTGLANGKARSYRVYAVNSMGRSAASKVVTVKPEAAPQRAAATAVRLPLPATTLVDPELVWSLGLGLIVVALTVALLRGGRRPRR